MVLHSRPYRESSLIIEWLTPGTGRVATVFKGARQRRRPAPVAFNSYQIRWAGRSALATLTDFEADTHRWLAGDAAVVGLYANELLMRLLAERDAHPRVFDAYLALVDVLTDSARGARVEQALRVFELTLLADIGYALELTHDASSGAEVRPDGRYRFDAEHGFAELGDERDTTDAFDGRLLLALANSQLLDGADRSESKRLMRLALAPHLSGRPLRATELLLSNSPSSPTNDTE